VFVHSNDISQLTGNENAMGIIETIKMLTWEEGFEKGMKIGIEKGMKIAIEQGMEKAMEIGEERKSYFVVTRMLRSGKLTISEILDFASVTEEFVNKVKREMQA
jgi:hypothetical protein